MDLKIGSNAFRNTNGIVAIQGKEQLVLEWHPDQHQLLVTLDLYNEQGRRIGHVRRNRLALGAKDTFDCSSGPETPSLFAPQPWVKIVAKKTEEVVLEVSVVDAGTIAISEGRFYTHKGSLVEINSHVCRVGEGTALFGEVKEMDGGVLKLE